MRTPTLVVVALACWLALALASVDGTSLVETSASVSLGVPHSGISIPLERFDLPEDKAETIIENLRMRQLHLDNPSFLEASAQVGDVKLERQEIEEKHLATYYGLIDIGGHEFRVLFDTGSCEMWVPSSKCKTATCSRHSRYPTSSAHRFKEMSAQRMNIQYLSGSVQGPMSFEEVKLGSVVVPKQLVGLADRVDITLLDQVTWDGIVGLAYPNESVRKRNVSPLFDTIIRDKVLSSQGLSNQFAYYIDSNGGALTFGGANCELLVPKGTPAKECVSKFGFVPISHKTYWTILLDDVSAKYPNGVEKKGLCGAGGCKAIVDTGTYLVYGPAASVKQALPASLGFCGNLNGLPDLTFSFRVPGNWPSVHLTLKPEDYVLKFNVKGRQDCVLGVSPDKDAMWTLGQVFLKSFYALFDRDNNRIGFARVPKGGVPAAPAPAPVPAVKVAAVEVDADAEAETETETEAEAEADTDAQAAEATKTGSSFAEMDIDAEADDTAHTRRSLYAPEERPSPSISDSLTRMEGAIRADAASSDDF